MSCILLFGMMRAYEKLMQFCRYAMRVRRKFKKLNINNNSMITLSSLLYSFSCKYVIVASPIQFGQPKFNLVM